MERTGEIEVDPPELVTNKHGTKVEWVREQCRGIEVAQYCH